MDRALTPTEYRLLVEHSPVMIWRAGTDAKCDYFNERWLAYTGRTVEQELGDGWAEGVHADDLERCVAYYLDHFKRREPFEMEYRLRRHDGVYRWIFDRGVPFTNESGEFAGFIGSCVDVDERRKAQEAQRQHNEDQLELARDFEKWVLAIVSHDIRNPLGTIQLAVRVLHSIPDATDAVKRNAGMIGRAAHRIQHMVEDLLDLSRERQGSGLHIKSKHTDLRAICREVIDELESLGPDCRISREGEGNTTGTWDEGRIMQAISNLASNAMQHGTPGCPIRIRLNGDERQVAVEVHNEGSIPGELLPHLFEPFRSVRQHAKRGDGLGLGLFIANAIARAHGGGLEVDCASGRTVFRLVLPRQSRHFHASDANGEAQAQLRDGS